LSAVIEFAHHSILFSGFKETTSENFESSVSDGFVPTRLNDAKFAKYSKILKPNGEYTDLPRCPDVNYEPESPIRSVPNHQLPNKKFIFSKEIKQF
jgi:hypothetical protein